MHWKQSFTNLLQQVVQPDRIPQPPGHDLDVPLVRLPIPSDRLSVLSIREIPPCRQKKKTLTKSRLDIRVSAPTSRLPTSSLNVVASTAGNNRIDVRKLAGGGTAERDGSVSAYRARCRHSNNNNISVVP